MDAAGDTKAVGPGGPPTPLLDLVIVQISPGEGSAHDALLAGLSSGAVYRRDEVFVWLAEWDEVNVTEIGSASMYPAFADPIPIWQVSATFASPTRPGRR